METWLKESVDRERYWERQQARAWQPDVYTHEEAGDLLARLAPRTPEPGYWDTLRAAVEAHPRFARAYVIVAALAVIAPLSMFWGK
jgi:hypothetical protein